MFTHITVALLLLFIPRIHLYFKVSRIFKLKKQQLIKDLGSEMIFGKMLARTHSIEFQKRGFPHLHVVSKRYT